MYDGVGGGSLWIETRIITYEVSSVCLNLHRRWVPVGRNALDSVGGGFLHVDMCMVA